MPMELYGFPLVPVIALVGGIIGLLWKDFLETIMAIFLIIFGLMGVLPVLGVDVSGVKEVIEQTTEGGTNGETTQ